MLDRRELIVNRDYQRGSELWPIGASSYFIDTILQGFPFPKIYMYEFFDRKERSVRKEIVDGQQRISAIQRYYANQFALSADAARTGMRFQDLDEEDQQRFLSYAVSVDVIRNANHSEILQMFRRMNAYTLPLNEAEKRHSSFQGNFKWFINEVSDHFNEFFVEFGVFTNRQIVRMSDAALLADCVVAIEKGVVSAAPKDLRDLYREYDENFIQAALYREMFTDTINFIIENFSELRRTFIMKPYALHSLITALMHSRFGIKRITEEWNAHCIGSFAFNTDHACQQLSELARAHEAKETDGRHAKYVWGCLSTTDRKARRTARVAAILRILGVDVPDSVDADLS
ncbi:DUF262 domain-containing protein [Pannonibacter carbonis]|uniref:DUF262 domain-containing protein n=1 Tax=Pannonibacter carbonis TaxID=2067569 RepID=UPI000D1004EC|nr:DUF262 domain-containing protein [Pannonibacter carbonis]